jgi:hypothetical protein
LANCPKCGAPLDPNARFCSNCGAIAIVTATQESIQPGPVSPLRDTFAPSTYLVHTKVSDAYRSRDGRSGLGIHYQYSTFEFRDSNGILLAISRHIEEGDLPTSTAKFASLSSLLSSTIAYVLETAQGVRIGELRCKAMLPVNQPCLEIKDAAGDTIAGIVMRMEKQGSGFFSPFITTWAIETPREQELARINWGKGNRDWTIETPDGETVAEVQRQDTAGQGYETTHQLKIMSTKIDPCLTLATFFATPPTGGGGFRLH